MLDFIIALNKIGVVYYSKIFNLNLQENQIMKIITDLLKECYIDQKRVEGNRKLIDGLIVEFFESKNNIIYIAIVSNIGLEVDFKNFFINWVSSLEKDFLIESHNEERLTI